MENKKIIVDKAKCKICDLCVKICPGELIIRTKPDELPIMKAINGDLCMGCGHCVAICPHGALNHSDVSLEKCPVVDKELSINLKQVTQFLRSRRSVRYFKDKPVDKKIIERLIQFGRYAPSGGNNQSVEWTIFTDSLKIKKLATLSIEAISKDITDNPKGLNATTAYIPEIVNNWACGRNEILWDAPVLIIASVPSWSESGMEDLILALSYLDLAAPSMGLGTCWTGSFTDSIQLSSTLEKELGLPDDCIHYYSMVLGYPKYKFQCLIERKEPKISWK